MDAILPLDIFDFYSVISLAYDQGHQHWKSAYTFNWEYSQMAGVVEGLEPRLLYTCHHASSVFLVRGYTRI